MKYQLTGSQLFGLCWYVVSSLFVEAEGRNGWREVGVD